MRKQGIVWIFIFALLFVLAACGEETAEPVDYAAYVDTSHVYTEQTLTEAQRTAYPAARIDHYYISGDYKVFCVTAKYGYKGEVQTVILLNNATIEKIAGVDIKESVNYGAKCFRDSYLAQFYGLDLSAYTAIRGKSQPRNEGEIVYVTGATVTSEAIIDAVNAIIIFIHP
ncbi:MAG: FMN-binding protein [Clostridia bacterium]|nr:FMN-binding protein [Clostridia bacterium]